MAVVNLLKQRFGLFGVYSFIVWAVSVWYVYPELIEKSSILAIYGLAVLSLIFLIFGFLELAGYSTVFIGSAAILLYVSQHTINHIWISLLILIIYFCQFWLISVKKSDYSSLKLVEAVFKSLIMSQVFTMAIKWNVSVLSSAMLVTAVFYMLSQIKSQPRSIKASIYDISFGIVILGIIIWLNFFF